MHGKKQFWMRGGNYHYHHGMAPGDNTLDAQLTRLLTRTMLEEKSGSPAVVGTLFQQKYIDFMTHPGNHNDTYANTCHRMFFKNWKDGIPPAQCPDNDGHNVDTIDALMAVPPVAIAHMHSSPAERAAAIKAAIQSTRRTSEVLSFANIYADMLLLLLQDDGVTMQQAAHAAGRQMNLDVAAMVRADGARRGIGSDPMTACYISSAFPALLHTVYKYGDLSEGGQLPAERALLASANAGGENVAKTSLLGALLGAKYGLAGLPVHLKEGLLNGKDIRREAEAFAEAFLARE